MLSENVLPQEKVVSLAGICTYVFVFHNVCDGCVSGSGTSPVGPLLNKAEEHLASSKQLERPRGDVQFICLLSSY